MGLGNIREKIRANSGFAFVSIGNLVAGLAAAIFWLLAAALIPVYDYGEINFHIAIASTIANIGLIGLNTAIITYTAKGYEDFLKQASRLVFAVGLGMAAVLALFSWTTAIFLAGMMFYDMAYSELLGRKNYRRFAVNNIAMKVSQVVLSLGLMFLMGPFGLILGYGAGYLAFSYPFFRTVKIAGKSFEVSLIIKKKGAVIHMFGLGISQMLPTTLDKMIIGALFGFSVLGIYQLGYQFLVGLSILPGSVFMYVLPEKSSGNSLNKARLYGVILAAIIALVLYLSASFIVNNIFPKYVDAIQLVQILTWGIIPLTFVSITNAAHISQEKGKVVFYASGLYAGLLLVGIALFGQWWGEVGLGYAMLLSLSVQAALLFLYEKFSRQ